MTAIFGITTSIIRTNRGLADVTGDAVVERDLARAGC